MLECSSGYINLTPSKWAEKDDRLVAMTRYIHKHIKRALSVECVTIGIRQLNLDFFDRYLKGIENHIFVSHFE